MAPSENASNSKLNIAIIGPPYSGKTTQATKISERFCLCHLTSTILLRSPKERAPAGKESKEIIEQGGVVSAQVMANLLRHTIENNPDCANGFVLDGIPRSLSEAEDMERMLKARQEKLDVVIELSANEALLKSRESGCLIHLLSGRTYHENYSPPKKYMKDDFNGEHLVECRENKPETLGKQLRIYESQRSPVIDHYKSLGIWKNIDGSQEIPEVWRKLAVSLNELVDRKKSQNSNL